MKLTKYTHSCVRIETDGVVLVIDPGTFSEVEQALEGAHHVLITHVHPDHLDLQRVADQMRSRRDLRAWAPGSVAEQLRLELGEEAPDSQGNPRIHAVDAETELDLDGVAVRTFGGQHALIHPLIRTVDNVGYLIQERLYHPGDSLVVPHGITPSTLLVPLHAPWSKMSEVIDFIIAVRPQRAHQIHDALLSAEGFGVVERQVSAFAAKHGTEYEHLDTGRTVEV